MRVVVAHRGADLLVGFKATAWGLHLDARRLEWEFGREEELTVVFASSIRSIGWASKDVVPFEDIVFAWSCVYERRRILVHELGLLGKLLR